MRLVLLVEVSRCRVWNALSKVIRGVLSLTSLERNVMSARKKSEDPWTIKEVVKSAISLVIFAGFLFMLSYPAIAYYNSTHYTMRPCTIEYANYYEQRTVATSVNLAIHTTDCGTLTYKARVSGEELQNLETKINEHRGQELNFGFGQFQFWSGPQMVYSVEGLDVSK